MCDLGEAGDTIALMEDNEACIALSKDIQYYKRTKHIQVRFYYFREQIQEGVVKLLFCPTKSQLADMLTKPLPGHRLRAHLPSLGLHQSEGQLK